MTARTLLESVEGLDEAHSRAGADTRRIGICLRLQCRGPTCRAQ